MHLQEHIMGILQIKRLKKDKMGKESKKRRLAENCAMAVDRSVRSSAQKLNLVAQSIRGMDASKALLQLQFSRKRIAVEVKKVLQSAIANAENNHDLDIDKLIVSEAYVGKALVMKRFRPRARGRGGKILKPISNLTVVVSESEEAPKQETVKKEAPKQETSKQEED